jgi:hypothetical protein
MFARATCRGLLFPGLNSQDKVADIYTITFIYDRGLLDSSAIDVRAVSAVQVCYDESPVTVEKLCMLLGYVALREQQVVALDAADTEFSKDKQLSSLGAPFFTYYYGERRTVELHRRCHHFRLSTRLLPTLIHPSTAYSTFVEGPVGIQLLAPLDSRTIHPRFPTPNLGYDLPSQPFGRHPSHDFP